jgi:hypothetical protein
VDPQRAEVTRLSRGANCAVGRVIEGSPVKRYARVMSIKRITISVPSAVASRIKKAAGDAAVSAWVTDVIEERLNDADLEKEWEQFHADVNPSPKDVARAEGMLKRLTNRSRRKGAA